MLGIALNPKSKLTLERGTNLINLILERVKSVHYRYPQAGMVLFACKNCVIHAWALCMYLGAKRRYINTFPFLYPQQGKMPVISWCCFWGTEWGLEGGANNYCHATLDWDYGGYNTPDTMIEMSVKVGNEISSIDKDIDCIDFVPHPHAGLVAMVSWLHIHLICVCCKIFFSQESFTRPWPLFCSYTE